MHSSVVVPAPSSAAAAAPTASQLEGGVKPPPLQNSAGLSSGLMAMDFTERNRPVITLETHYNELVRMIAEIGKDIKPAYTNSRVSTERLRKNIMVARGVVRECFSDLDKLANS